MSAKGLGAWGRLLLTVLMLVGVWLVWSDTTLLIGSVEPFPDYMIEFPDGTSERAIQPEIERAP
jgi:hypothetical protein